jgi:hypothetical protein
MSSDRIGQVEELAKHMTDKFRVALELATRTCITCDNWQPKDEKCMLNGLHPPAKIIAFGCECYSDEIPF